MSVKWVEVVEGIHGNSFSLYLLSYESRIFVKEKPDRKKQKQKANYALQHVRKEQTFNDGGPYYTKTSSPIQERATSLKHERVNALLFACILTEIYSLIMRKQLTSMHPNIKRGCFN